MLGGTSPLSSLGQSTGPAHQSWPAILAQLPGAFWGAWGAGPFILQYGVYLLICVACRQDPHFRLDCQTAWRQWSHCALWGPHKTSIRPAQCHYTYHLKAAGRYSLPAWRKSVLSAWLFHIHACKPGMRPHALRQHALFVSL